MATQANSIEADSLLSILSARLSAPFINETKTTVMNAKKGINPSTPWENKISNSILCDADILRRATDDSGIWSFVYSVIFAKPMPKIGFLLVISNESSQIAYRPFEMSDFESFLPMR